MIMPPPNPHTPCEEHSRRLEKAEQRLEKGDAILATVKRIELAVCGDDELGIPGLVKLSVRVESLERGRAWLLGAAAALGVILPLAVQYITK